MKLRMQEATDQYLEHMRSKGLERRTIKNHSQPLTKAIETWGNIYVETVTPRHIDTLFASAGWGASTQNLYLSILRGGFFAWCRRNRVIGKDVDPTEGWRNLKVPTRHRLWVGVDEFADLLESCDNARDRAVVALGLFTLCRGSELAGIRISDLDFDRHTVNIYRVKTKEADVLPMPLELESELRLWLAEYEREVGAPLQGHWWLVPARGPLPMRQDPVTGKLRPTGEPARLRPETRLGKPYACVNRALARIGYTESGTGAHTLRRSGARAWFEVLRDGGYDSALRKVSALLGHKSVSMTERYLGLELEKQQRNEILQGRAMFPGMWDTAKIVNIRKVL